MTTRYFGSVEAHINDQEKTVRLEYAKRRRQPLDDETRKACVDWAKSQLAEYQARGYEFFYPQE